MTGLLQLQVRTCECAIVGEGVALVIPSPVNDWLSDMLAGDMGELVNSAADNST